MSPTRSSLDCNGCLKGSGFIDTLTLPSNGTYEVRVDPVGTSTGSVTITVFTVTDVTANITANGTANSVSITTPGQNAHLDFSGTTGQNVFIDITNNGFPACFQTSLTVSLISPTWGTVTSNSCLKANGFIDTLTRATAGLYEVRVDPYGTTTGTVTISVYTVTDTTANITANGTANSVSTTTPGQIAHLYF